MKESKSKTDAIQERLWARRKYMPLFACVLIVGLSLGTVVFLVHVLARDAVAAATVIRVDPDTTIVDPDETFSVTVEIKNVENLGAFQFDLIYDPACVMTTGVEIGSFLGSTGRTVAPVGPIYGSNSVTFGAYSLGVADGSNGDGTLAIITFDAGSSECTSALQLQGIIVTDHDGHSIAATTEDGEVIVGTASAPDVTGITPDSGCAGQTAQQVLVTGQGFLDGAFVKLTQAGQSDILATFVTVNSTTQISCTLNLGKAVVGDWNVVVVNPDDQQAVLPNGFTVTGCSSPAITSITPGSGRPDQVVPITNLAGSDFQDGATVKLIMAGASDIDATDVVVVSSSKITCQFDLAGATTGLWTVVVTNPDAQQAELLDGFNVIDTIQSTISSITPNEGTNDGAVTITNLAGGDFAGGATVKLTKAGEDDIDATHINVVSSTKITCRFDLTGKAAGRWNVVVTNPGVQQSQLDDGFTVIGQLFLPSVRNND
jgi:hypothetical protein